MRCTQYIGLTDAARDFLGRIKAEKVKVVQIGEGMFGEPVMGDVWKASVNGCDLTITEAIDLVPWSSGPMIFTCLDVEEQGESWKNYRWNFDPSCENEYDVELGVYCV